MKKEKEKASASIEQIFAHAVALDQSGRLRCTIYALGKKIFIRNSDNTVIMRFFSPDGIFKNPVSFKANDYEGNAFYEEEGKIVFESNNNGYEKKKSCGTPGMKPEKVEELFKEFKPIKKNRISIHKDILSLLDKSLSHVEISARKGKFYLVQRNIYSGAIIEVSKSEGGLGISGDKIKGSFGPVGLRTSDFEAMFTFQDSLDFFFDPKMGYVIVKGRRWKMKAIIGMCLYDEIGHINYLKEE